VGRHRRREPGPRAQPRRGRARRGHPRRRHPATDKGNLAYRNLPGLVDGFTDILRGCATLLRPDGVVVVTARPWRKHGELVDLPSAVIAAGTAAGLVPIERCIALLTAVRDGHLVARPSFFQLQQVRRARALGVPMHLIAHEDVIVLTKGPRSASEAAGQVAA
jgi:modification methylase